MQLGENFLKSRFKGLAPAFVEQSLEFELAGTIVVCKLDAVYQNGQEFEIVDWKSGSSPKSDAEIASRAIQLALYRIGFAKWQKIGVERVKAMFFFSGDGKELAPEVPSEAELRDRLLEIRTALRP